MTTIQVDQFGPIIKGNIELKPLTIFVGPNNSGKSYFAVLIYSILRSILYPGGLPVGRWSRGIRFAYRRYWGLGELIAPDIVESKEFHQLLKESLQEHLVSAKKGDISLRISDLPKMVQDGFLSGLSNYSEQITSHLGDELQRCWATDVSDLVRKTSEASRRKTFKVSISQSRPPLNIDMKNVGDDLKLVNFIFEPSDLNVILRRSLVYALRRQPEQAFYEVLDNLLRHSFREFAIVPYYLPAARSGILQNHKALASSAVSRATLVGIRRFPEIPLFPGVVADFISNVIELEKRKPGELNTVASFLESSVMRGEIDIEAGKHEYPELYYKTPAGRFSLHRTSSMVSELAPLALFLKYVINPGNFLIIEEPESHLHPEGQRRMARIIVRLVRASVRVLITTHSDYFVEQLNNFVRLAKGSEADRFTQQYSAKDFLKPEEIGAYLFDLDEQKEGTVVKKLAVSDEEGIADEEFAKVTESLYEETVSLDRMIKR